MVEVEVFVDGQVSWMWMWWWLKREEVVGAFSQHALKFWAVAQKQQGKADEQNEARGLHRTTQARSALRLVRSTTKPGSKRPAAMPASSNPAI